MLGCKLAGEYENGELSVMGDVKGAGLLCDNGLTHNSLANF